MKRLRVGVTRFASVANAIADALGIEPQPDCRIGHGRIMLTFRRLGASRWPEKQQIEFALRAAGIAREVLAADSRRTVRGRASRAIVVVYEDATLLSGCSVIARWECVVPPGAE